MNPLTRQEIFDRAWRGLEAQSWQQALGDSSRGQPRCVYSTDDGRRCAWGHVDPSLTSKDGGTVSTLWYGDQGNTRTLLSQEDLGFAGDLQLAHDQYSALRPESEDNVPVRTAFERLAAKYGLTIPTE